MVLECLGVYDAIQVDLMSEELFAESYAYGGPANSIVLVSDH